MARARAEAMLGNQEFVFQIDAHSTFVEGWDEKLIGEWCREFTSTTSYYFLLLPITSYYFMLLLAL